MSKIIGIYRITSPTGSIYIGQSIDIYHRWYMYKKLHCKGQPSLYSSFKEHGVDAHKFEIICECEVKDLSNLEKIYVGLYKTFNTAHGLNLKPGGKTSLMSEASKKKHSESLKKAWAKNPRPSTMKGKKMSEESKRKLSIGKLGKNNLGENPNAKLVLDDSNGIFYTSLKEACRSKGLNYSTVKSNVQGVTNHSKFQLRYV